MNYLMLEKYYPNYSLKINFKVARKLFFFMKLPMSIHKPWQFFLNQCIILFLYCPNSEESSGVTQSESRKQDRFKHSLH